MRNVAFLNWNLNNGMPIFQYLAMFAGTLNIICSGMHYGWPSPSLPKLLQGDSHIPMTSDEGSWVAVILLLGTFCGSVLGGLLLDKVGRKNVILLSSVPFFTSWMMVAFAQSVLVLIAARFVAGISDGLIFCSIPIYLGEISNPNIRGLFGSCVSVAWIFGIMLINIIGSYLTISTTALIASAIPVLLFWTFYWVPESPYYLIMKNNLEQARRSLSIFKGTNDVEDELKRLVQAVQGKNVNSGSFLDLFTVKSNRRALYIMMITRGAQQFSGITAITFYAQIIFGEAGDSITPTTGSIIYFGMQLFLVGMSSMIVDKTGRRPLMIISIIGVILALLIEGCYFYVQNRTDIDTSNFALVPIIALIIFVIVFSIGMQTIPIILLGEIFATEVKAVAITFSDIYFSVITACTSKFFQITKDELGMHVPFFAFTAFAVLGLFLIILYVPETKGKTLEEIQLELKGERVKNKTLELAERFRRVDIY